MQEVANAKESGEMHILEPYFVTMKTCLFKKPKYEHTYIHT